jgi:hypothetical protein
MHELLERFAGIARERPASEGDAVWAEGHPMKFEDAVTLAVG